MAETNKPQHRSANGNAWYHLATLFGEPTDGLDAVTIEENRIAWNRWMAGSLDEETRANLIEKGFPPQELAPYGEAELAGTLELFAQRTGRDGAPPHGTYVDFRGIKFDRPIYFSGFLFDELDCRSTIFSDDASFKSATFLSEVNFNGAMFLLPINFASATFCSHANFGCVTSCFSADFSKTIFLGSANFIAAKFANSVCFSSTVFRSEALFNSAEFSFADFGCASFSSETFFKATTFASRVSFLSAIFYSGADFMNVIFKDRTTFFRAVFKKHVPDFRGATFHEATEWDYTRWPPPLDGPRVFSDSESTRAEIGAALLQVYAYQRLKQEMERRNKHED